MPPRTSPDSLTGASGEAPRNPEQREKAKKEVKQQLTKLMADVRARGTAERDPASPEREKRLKELGARITQQERALVATFAQLLNPDGSLPQDVEKELAAEFSDKESAEIINNLINGDANRLSTEANNLGREIDGQRPVSQAENLIQQGEQRLSSIIDGLIENSSLPVPPAMLQQAKPLIIKAIRGIFVSLAEKASFIPGAQEFVVRSRAEATWQPLLKLKMQNPAIAKRIREQGGPDAVKELYMTAMIGHAANQLLSQQARQSFNEPMPTLESVLGMPSPATTTTTSPGDQDATKKKEAVAAAAADRPLGTEQETIQDLPMSFVNNEFRVQKGGDTYKAAAKHGNDAATVTEVKPVRPATSAIETLQVKTRKGTEDLTKTVRAMDIKNALDNSGAKRVTVDNVTLEFTRI